MFLMSLFEGFEKAGDIGLALPSILTGGGVADPPDWGGDTGGLEGGLFFEAKLLKAEATPVGDPRDADASDVLGVGGE